MQSPHKGGTDARSFPLQGTRAPAPSGDSRLLLQVDSRGGFALSITNGSRRRVASHEADSAGFAISVVFAACLRSPRFRFSQKRSPRSRDLAHSHRQRGEGLPPTTRTGGGCKLVGWGWLLCRRSFWRGASALWLEPSHPLGLQIGAAAKASASNAESGRH